MTDLKKTRRTRVRRAAERGLYDRAVANAILDEGLVAHVGFSNAEGPVVIPMAYARVDDVVLLHGSVASRLLKTAAQGVPVCVTVTLLDGVVVSRSWFNHSMNYRSVVLFGRASPIEDDDDKQAAMVQIVEHLLPGSVTHARSPNRKEFGATLILRLAIDEASVKVRSGPPEDNPADLTLTTWAGVIPLTLTASAPLTAPDMPVERDAPAFAACYSRRVPD